nr:ArsC/Spx/MgsR family protein [Shewanella glacialipiscicola]
MRLRLSTEHHYAFKPSPCLKRVELPLNEQILQTPPSRPELLTLIAAMGIPTRALLRANVAPFEELGLANDRFSDDELVDFMLAHPILINRPIVVTPLGTKLCRPSEVVLDILPNLQQGTFSKEDGDAVIDIKGKRLT